MVQDGKWIIAFSRINNSFMIESDLSRFIKLVKKSSYNNSIQTLVVSIECENSDEMNYTWLESGFLSSTYFKIIVFENAHKIYRILRGLNISLGIIH